MMWVNQLSINKHIFINHDDFDIIHFIQDGWRSDDLSDVNLILFEYNLSWYIADLQDNASDMGFNSDFFANANSQNKGRVYKDGSDWLLDRGFSSVSGHLSTIWKKSEALSGGTFNARALGNRFKLNQSTMIWEPYPVATGSLSLSEYNFSFVDVGQSVYKSNTQLGTYAWQGEGVKDDIIVGYRKYSHKAIDSEGNQTNEDVIVTQSVNLINYVVNRWRYDYQGKSYFYKEQVLPLSNIEMETTTGEKLQMTYIELITLKKQVDIFDGGAQIVD
jgi:hypothetical protein